MLGTALSTLSKLDLSRLDRSDVGNIAAILRDSARFDGRAAARRGGLLARRTGQYVATHPRQTGLGLGGIAALGLAGFAVYKLYTANKPAIEAAVDDAVDTAKEKHAALKAKVADELDDVTA